MGRLGYLILSLLFVSCSINTDQIVHGDTGVVTNISLNGDYYLVTVTFSYKIEGAGYTDNVIFYTKEKYNINDKVKFSRE